MYKTTAIILVVLGIAGLFLAYSFSGRTILSPEVLIEEPTAWIEVSSPRANEVGPAKETIRELKTGDEIKPGQAIELDKNGLAVIHFSDGSVLRLESETRVVLDEAIFKKEDGTLSVKVTLIAGKVWSKVIALVSPESAWEVRTSNAVATVRGTSFGVKYINGQAGFIGAENRVTIAVLDPKTKKPIEETRTVLTEARMIEIKDNEISGILAKPKVLASRDIPEVILGEAWVKKNKDADRAINEKLDEFEKETGSEKKAREKLREKTFEKFKEIREERRKDEVSMETGDDRGETSESLSPSGTTEVSPERAVVNTIPAKPEKLIVTTPANTKTLVEGTKTSFKATLFFSDGTSRDVTGEALWQTDGQIGKIESPGILVAGFGEGLSEVPSVSGNVFASWTKGEITIKAEPFSCTIIHFAEETIERG